MFSKTENISEENDVNDFQEIQNDRLELLKTTGDGLKSDEKPQIKEFFKNKTFLVLMSEFSTSCPKDGRLLDEPNITSFDQFDKIKILFTLLCKIQEKSNHYLEESLAKLDHLKQEKLDIDSSRKSYAVRNMKVIGMTISGASIQNDLVQKIKSEVVIVEEAAEILEPQLLVSLTPNVKHLIMIGDHKQLPPKVDTWKLKTKYHLDISMMQRLIQCKLDFVQLKLQNRMRPEIATLLKDIYPDLQSNNERVSKHPKVNIIDQSTIFWDHDHDEDSGRSKTNNGEAEMVINLALLLILYGEKAADITILCAYLGQTKLVRNKLKSYQKQYPELLPSNFDESIVVNTVDMYQGDENRVVIVSLVRSNENGTVGFLKEMARRCVAQSRAKSCVIFVGNSKTISKAPCWKPIMDKVSLKSKTLTIHCPKHPQLSLHSISQPNDIKKFLSKPFELCQIKCGTSFVCNIQSHNCKELCQPDHHHNKCKSIVNILFPSCGHAGNRECWQEETKMQCQVLIDFKHKRCGHPDTRLCHKGCVEEKIQVCKMECQGSMDCNNGHKCNKVCGEDHKHDICKALVKFCYKKCGHKGTRLCYEKEEDKECDELVNQVIPACKHSINKSCHASLEKIICETEVFIKLPCGHENKKKCYKKLVDVICKHPCQKKLPCAHPCMKFCGEICSQEDCDECRRLKKAEINNAIQDAKKWRDELTKRIRRNGNEKGFHKKEEVRDQSEFDSQKNLVLKFIVPDHNWVPNITKIERVVNTEMEAKWWDAKSKLFDPCRDYDLKFHGTGDDGVQGICFGDGFRLPQKSRNNMYGQGVYFASNSSKSAREIYTKGSNKLLLCKVWLGKAKTAITAMNSLTPEDMKKDGFDSIYAPAGSAVKNDEFIIYNPAQALPAYIIHYQCDSTNPIPKLNNSVLLNSGHFSKKTLLPKREYDAQNSDDLHFMIAESRFHRMLAVNAAGQRHKIINIDVINNATLNINFNKMVDDFKSKGIDATPILSFHGTPQQNIESILKENFSMTKSRGGTYGRGIYFSEFPTKSIGYTHGSNSLILCKILLGKSGEHSTQHQPDADGRCVEIVIKGSVDQILPCYVINFQ